MAHHTRVGHSPPLAALGAHQSVSMSVSMSRSSTHQHAHTVEAAPHARTPLDVTDPNGNTMTLLRNVESVYFESMTSEDAKNKMHREKAHTEELNRRLREDIEKLTLQLAQEKQRRQADQSLHSDLEHNARLMEEIVEKQKEVAKWHDDDHAILKDVHESSGCHREVLARLTRDVGRLKELQQERKIIKKHKAAFLGRAKDLKARLLQAEAHHMQRDAELRLEMAAALEQQRATTAEVERVASVQLEALRAEHVASATEAAAAHEAHAKAAISALASELAAAEGTVQAKEIEVRRISSESVDLVGRLKNEAAQALEDAKAHAKTEIGELAGRHDALRQEKEALTAELATLQQQQEELLARGAAATEAHEQQNAALTASHAEQLLSVREELNAKGAALESTAAELDALRAQSTQAVVLLEAAQAEIVRLTTAVARLEEDKEREAAEQARSDKELSDARLKAHMEEVSKLHEANTKAQQLDEQLKAAVRDKGDQQQRAEAAEAAAAEASAAAVATAAEHAAALKTLLESQASTQREWDAAQQEHKSRAALLEATTKRVEALEGAEVELRARADGAEHERDKERREHAATLGHLEEQLRAREDDLEQAHAATSAAQAAAHEAKLEAAAQAAAAKAAAAAAADATAAVPTPVATPIDVQMADAAAPPAAAAPAPKAASAQPLPLLGGPTSLPGVHLSRRRSGGGNSASKLGGSTSASKVGGSGGEDGGGDGDSGGGGIGSASNAAPLVPEPAVVAEKENASQPPAEAAPLRLTSKSPPRSKLPPPAKLAPPIAIDNPPAPKPPATKPTAPSAPKPPVPASAKVLSASAMASGRSQSVPAAARPAAKRQPEVEHELEAAPKEHKRARSLGSGSGSQGATFNRRRGGSSSMIKSMGSTSAAASFDLFDF